MNQNINTNSIKKINSSINYIVKGLIISLVFTFISLIILSAVLTYTSVPESVGNSAIIVVNSISILIGSGITTKNQKSKGILKGSLCAICYIGIIYILSSLISLDFTVNIDSIIMIVTSIIAGGIGGIIGINLGKK